MARLQLGNMLPIFYETTYTIGTILYIFPEVKMGFSFSVIIVFYSTPQVFIDLPHSR